MAAIEPELALLRAGADTPPEAVLAGQAGAFEPVPGGQALLAAVPGQRHWIRVRAPLRPAAGERRHYLWFDQVPLNSVTLYRPGDEGWRTQRLAVFAPEPGQSMLSPGLSFALDGLAGEAATLYLEVDADVNLTLRPLLMGEEEYLAHDRVATVVLAAVYTGLLLLLLNAMVMYVALRERSYVCYSLFVLAVLALLLALNGQLYGLPGLGLFGWWGALGVFALAHLLAAAVLLMVREFAALGHDAPWADRLLRYAPWPFLGMALVCLLNVQRFAEPLQRVSAVLWSLASLGVVAIAAVAVRHRRPLARPLFVVWLLVAAFTGGRVLLVFGWLPQSPLLIYGFQVSLAFAAFLLSVALADRIIEFRRQRDRTRLAKEQIDASLQVEQARRHFADALQTGLRAAPPGDLEWVAFRKLLEAVRPLVRQNGSAVIVFGYHDLDLLLAEPLAAKGYYSSLLAERGGSIKGLCRARNPVQIHLSQGAREDARGGVFAVVPMPIPRPGWGAILIERPPWENFEPAELELVAEFAHIACSAADEVAASVDLKRRAELDPLTGALNRRAMETRLVREIDRAHAAKEPLSLLFLDLDHFKQVNDRFGHGVGDDCLRLLAEVVRREVGVDHVFGRYGGEEFVLVLPGLPADRARVIGERIRIALTQERVDAEGIPVRLTVSIGIASRHPDEKEPRALIERADKALYAAKNAGRNQVHVAPAYAVPGQATDPLPFL